MNNIHCVDETLDINSTALYHLSIQVSLNGLCYTILNSVNNKYILLKYFPYPDNISEDIIYEKIEETFNNEELLNKQYMSVKIIYVSPKYTLIPDEYFNLNSSKAIYELNHFLNDLDEIHHNQIKKLDAHLIFTIPNQIANPIYSKFQEVHFYHHSTPLINYSLNEENKNNLFRININDDFFDLLICSDNKLKLHNTFFYKSPHDILYYLLYALKTTNIKPEDSTILCSGYISKSGEIVKLLKQYFPTVKFQTPNSSYVYSYTLNKIPSHTFVNLLNLASCE